MSDELSPSDAHVVATAVLDLVAVAEPLIDGIRSGEPGEGCPAAAQRADPSNYAHSDEGDSAVAGTHDAIAWVMLAALDHARGFARIVDQGLSVSPGVLARAGVEALGIVWHQLSAPDVKTMLSRSANIRQGELYFPAKNGAQIEDGHGGHRSTTDRRTALKALIADQGFDAPTKHNISEMATAVLDAAFTRDGAMHYSQLSTIAHSALPAIAMHMSPTGLRPSRSLITTGAGNLLVADYRVAQAP